jgi:hypothetical protein
MEGPGPPPSAILALPALTSARFGFGLEPFDAPPPGRLVQPLEFPKRFAFFDMTKGLVLNAGDIVHVVASIPDSLENWFYGEKRHEEGKAFGCSV